MKAFKRDMLFSIFSLVLFYWFLAEETISLEECIGLIFVFILYVAVIAYQQWGATSADKSLEKASDEELELGISDYEVGKLVR